MKSLKKLVVIILALAIAVLGCALFAACDKDKPDHTHIWQEVENTATCTDAGVITRVCTICDVAEREASPALGHDWDFDKPVKYDTKPDCYTTGFGTVRCKRCLDEADMELPIHHDRLFPEFDKTIVASCTTEGVDYQICKICGAEVITRSPALGHDFTGTSVITKESTCEETGIRELRCKRKNCDGDGTNTPAAQKTVIPALGHDWQTSATLDVEPTFTSEGRRSVHCSRCDKTREGSEQTVPKLVAGQAIEYSLRVARFNHEALSVGLSDITITIKDAQGNTVATSNRDNFANGVMKVMLQPAEYTATIAGLPAGFRAQEQYEIHPGSVEKDLVVNASLLPLDDVTADTEYKKGYVLHDYVFNDIYGKQTTLGELLATHKIVLLNFFFVTCGACQSEMPGLLSAYNIYKDDMAIVMLDVYRTDTPDAIKNNFIRPFGVPTDSIYVMQDITPNGGNDADYNNICEKFDVHSAPQNVIVDREGVAVYAEDGATSDMQFRAMFKKYTNPPYSDSAPAQQASDDLARMPEAEPTKKRED